MLKRGLDEEGGTYYRLFTEGLIENYDGHMIVRRAAAARARLQPQLPRRLAARRASSAARATSPAPSRRFAP